MKLELGDSNFHFTFETRSLNAHSKLDKREDLRDHIHDTFRVAIKKLYTELMTENNGK